MKKYFKESVHPALLSVVLLLMGVSSYSYAHDTGYDHKHVNSSAGFDALMKSGAGKGLPIFLDTEAKLPPVEDVVIPKPKVDLNPGPVMIAEPGSEVPVAAVSPDIVVTTVTPALVEQPVASPDGPRKGAIPQAFSWIKHRPTAIKQWFNGVGEAYDEKVAKLKSGKKDLPTEE